MTLLINVLLVSAAAVFTQAFSASRTQSANLITPSTTTTLETTTTTPPTTTTHNNEGDVNEVDVNEGDVNEGDVIEDHVTDSDEQMWWKHMFPCPVGTERSQEGSKCLFANGKPKPTLTFHADNPQEDDIVLASCYVTPSDSNYIYEFFKGDTSVQNSNSRFALLPFVKGDEYTCVASAGGDGDVTDTSDIVTSRKRASITPSLNLNDDDDYNEYDVIEDAVPEVGLIEDHVNEGDVNEGDVNEGDVNESSANEVDVNEGDVNEIAVNEGDVNEGDVIEDHVNEGDVKEGDVNEGNVNEGDANEVDVNEGDVNEGDVNEVAVNEDDVNEGDVNDDGDER